MNNEEKNKTQEFITEIETDPKKADDLYDTIRKKVTSFKQERFQGKYGEVIEYLLILPDFIALLVRLARDTRIDTAQKVMIGGIILYVVSPIDILPDFIPVLGMIDDLLLVVYGINTILNEIDPEIVKEHWSGEKDLLETLKNTIAIAEKFLSRNVISKISGFFKTLRGKRGI